MLLVRLAGMPRPRETLDQQLRSLMREDPVFLRHNITMDDIAEAMQALQDRPTYECRDIYYDAHGTR